MKAVELDCGHILWFETVPDSVDDTLWCSRCDRYIELAPTVAKLKGVWVFNADEDFRSKRIGARRFQGECLVSGCEFTTISLNWFLLRDTMHKHYTRKHTKRGPIDIQYTSAKLPPDSLPPF